MTQRLLHVLAISLLFLALRSTPAFGQTWNGGGWSTGYGTVYGSFGQALATQNMYNTMQAQMQRTMMRQAMIKKWGLAAVEKAEREAASGKAPQKGADAPSPPPPPVVRNLGKFKPDRKIEPGQGLADALVSTPEEKEQIRALVRAAKQAFESQEPSRAWRNNVAGAFTFFLVGTWTIYNDAAEPSDQTAVALFQAVNQAFDELPTLGEMSARDKQLLYDTLIGFTALPLALYTEAKQSNDAQTLATSRALAGKLMELVLKTDPAKVRLAGAGAGE